MITVKEAKEIIQKEVKDFGIESLPLDQSVGRILREDLNADRDFPPYNRVTMDGIVIQYKGFENGQRIFPISGIAAAGSPLMKLEDEKHCLEVMTGSILPENSDTVIRYEDLEIANGAAKLMVDKVKKGQNIHRKGEDRLAGSLVVKSKVKISPAEIGVAATIGKTHLKVSRLPKVVIISTGDELVEVAEKPLAHQIRRSNVHRLKATLLQQGISADTLHLNDDMIEIKKSLAVILEKYEVVILSGGVSKGKFDFIPQAMEDLSVQKLFHKIKQRPGKPFWFGKAKTGTLIFALPGNPVSSFMCTQIYFLPWLKKSLGISFNENPKAVLTEQVIFKPDLVYYLSVAVSFDESGKILATPQFGNGSGDLANLAEAGAFLELPRGRNTFQAGEVFSLTLYRDVF